MFYYTVVVIHRILVVVNFGLGSSDQTVTVNLESQDQLIPGIAEVLVITDENMDINVCTGKLAATF